MGNIDNFYEDIDVEALSEGEGSSEKKQDAHIQLRRR